MKVAVRYGDQVTVPRVKLGEGLVGFAFGTDDAEECCRALRARGLSPTDPIPGTGRDEKTGAERSWRNVIVPSADSRGPLVFAIEHLSPSEALPTARYLTAVPFWQTTVPFLRGYGLLPREHLPNALRCGLGF